MNNKNGWLSRTELLLGDERLKKLSDASVLIAGLGGVGACAAEFICRSGVGSMTIVDADSIEASNRNRQLPALLSTENKPKAEVVAERLRDINPDVEIKAVHAFLKDEKTDEVLSGAKYDYVVDAIDSLTPKVMLIKKCVEKNINIVSSMGSGGKTDPALVRICDIEKSYNCKLARSLRKRLHRFGIFSGVKVVFSPEDVSSEAVLQPEDPELKNPVSIVGTISYMPALFGCFCASAVIRDIAGI